MALACAAAALDWVDVSAGDSPLHIGEYVAKPLTALALIGAAATLHTPDPSRRSWFLVALAFCLLGDIALMVPSQHPGFFGAGLASFFVAQVCFIGGLLGAHADPIAFVVVVAVLAVASAYPSALVLNSVRRRGPRALVPAVAAYSGALVVMASLAVAVAATGADGRDQLLAIGGLAFLVSDTLLALDKFVRRIDGATLLVHATYHVAIALLVLSLAGTT